MCKSFHTSDTLNPTGSILRWKQPARPAFTRTQGMETRNDRNNVVRGHSGLSHVCVSPLLSPPVRARCWFQQTNQCSGKRGCRSAHVAVGSLPPCRRPVTTIVPCRSWLFVPFPPSAESRIKDQGPFAIGSCSPISKQREEVPSPKYFSLASPTFSHPRSDDFLLFVSVEEHSGVSLPSLDICCRYRASSCYDASVKGGHRSVLAPIPAPEGPNSRARPTITSFRTSLKFGPRFLIYPPSLKVYMSKVTCRFRKLYSGLGGQKAFASIRIGFDVVTKTYQPFILATLLGPSRRACVLNSALPSARSSRLI